MTDFHALIIDFEFFVYSIQLANTLSELCQVTLMLPDKLPSYYFEGIVPRVNLQKFHMPRIRHPANLAMIHNIRKVISSTNPQIIHQLAWNLWMNISLPFLPKIPLVTTIHDASRHPGDRASFTWFQDFQWRLAEMVIVHAESIKQNLIRDFNVQEEKIRVIPFGPFELYQSWGRAGYNVEKPYILFFGRIWEYKGLQYLIEAEPLITAEIPEARIVIAGEGEDFAKYEKMMVNKDHFIIHNRYIPDEMVACLFQEASLVALPYVEASQSGVAAVAYAFGKPVVATQVGGIPEIVEHNQTGLLVPPRDAPSLAQAIISLLKNADERQRMSRNALKKIQSELSWKNIGLKTLDVYQTAFTKYAAKH